MRRHLQRVYWVGIACTLLMALIAVLVLLAFRIKDKGESLRSVLETASAWTMEADGDLNTHARRIASVSPPIRVTFLMDSGLVLADSDEDALWMNNHLDRPEVQGALRGEIGQSLRISDTQSVFMLYAAKRISPNLILRLGYPINMITHAFFLYSAGIGILFISLYVFQRRSLSRLMALLTRQMDNIRRTLEGDNTPAEAVFPELKPALDNIAYRAMRLNSDLEEVRKTLTLRSDFVANASHELRSPLTSIMGFAEMLDDGLADTPEERDVCIKTIRGECRRMLDVVEDVLLLSRAEREQDLAFTDVPVETVAEEVCQALSPQAMQKSIVMHVEGSLTLRAVEKDIWEILHNLTGNAIRYGRQGGWVKIVAGDNTVSVYDNGVGIEAQHLPHLFEQFYRVDQSRDPSVRGTGLGLSIVRTLAERNGGKVSVESTPGEGSRFTVTFGREETPV